MKLKIRFQEDSKILILTRRPGESIIIGDNIEVKVMQVGSGNQVKIGISAPPDVAVDREEIRVRKDADKHGGNRQSNNAP